MTRISELCATQSLASAWVKSKQEEVEGHAAWMEIADSEAEVLLKGQAPYTYLLRKGEEGEYFISFMKSECVVKHQKFTIEKDLHGFYFKNGTTTNSREVISDSLEDLIAQMMLCRIEQSSIVTRTANS